MTQRILVVEDDQALQMILDDRLRSEGYDVDIASQGEEAVKKATKESYALIVLDVMLPKKSGFDVCREVRKAGVVAPILMLTARGQIVDKVLGLRIGADDYLTKPFDFMELMARIEALLRRPAIVSNTESFTLGTLEIDFRGTSVQRGGVTVPLSAREFRLLRYMVENQGATLSRDVLLKEVWGYSSETFTRTVDVHIASLRQKLEDDPKQPSLIVTVPGLGYKFAPSN